MPAPPHAEPQEVAAFIQRMVAELKGLAAERRLDFLAYLLDIAHDEAAQRAVEPPGVRRSAR